MTIRDSQDDVQSGQFFSGGPKTLAFGGIGGVIILLVGAYFGIDPKILGSVTQNVINTGNSLGALDQNHSPEALKECTKNGKILAIKANNIVCRIYIATSSANTVWGSSHLKGHWTVDNAKNYSKHLPKINIFHNSVGTRCGSATSAVGPFYCPADHTAYFDTGFFQSMMQRLGASTGVLAQFYVVEHEIGHHIQTILGFHVRNRRQGSKSDSVRLELQADCFAGFWASFADKGSNPALEPITQDQIEQVIQTTKAIGDDTLQQKHGSVNSSEWTHGSSEQRTKWFLTGYRGDINNCNTWTTDVL